MFIVPCIYIISKKINEVYKDPNIWMTSGSFKYSDGRPGFNKPITSTDNIRKSNFTLSHMRTWKSWLWKKIEEKDLKMKQKYIDDSDYIMKWWKPKAIKRYTKLHEENRLKPEKLFYGDIVGKTWEETKEQYLGEVGR